MTKKEAGSRHVIEQGDGYAAWHIDAGEEVAREH